MSVATSNERYEELLCKERALDLVMQSPFAWAQGDQPEARKTLRRGLVALGYAIGRCQIDGNARLMPHLNTAVTEILALYELVKKAGA